MLDSVTLSCPSCGAKLQITDDIDRFACRHCGTEQIVRRQAGIVSLAPVVGELKKIHTASDATARELAVARLRREIDDMQEEILEVASRIASQESRRFIVACWKVGRLSWLQYMKAYTAKELRPDAKILGDLSASEMGRFIAEFQRGVIIRTGGFKKRMEELERIAAMKTEIEEKKSEMKTLLTYKR